MQNSHDISTNRNEKPNTGKKKRRSNGCAIEETDRKKNDPANHQTVLPFVNQNLFAFAWDMYIPSLFCGNVESNEFHFGNSNIIIKLVNITSKCDVKQLVFIVFSVGCWKWMPQIMRLYFYSTVIVVVVIVVVVFRILWEKKSHQVWATWCACVWVDGDSKIPNENSSPFWDGFNFIWCKNLSDSVRWFSR